MALIFGDFLNIDEGVILHQVNIFGTMGGGIAYHLSKTYNGLEDAYARYVDKFVNNIDEIYGKVFYHKVHDNLIIGNCFSQLPKAKHSNGGLTSYDAVVDCFNNAREVFGNNAEIYIPFKFGCGIAGGNWLIVHEIAKEYNMTIIARQTDYSEWNNSKHDISFKTII